MMSSTKNFAGERIKMLRMQKRITQDKVSELAEITPGYLGQIERGEKNPSIKTLTKIASALDVTLDSLLVKCDDERSKHVQMLLDVISDMSIEHIDYVIKHATIVKESIDSYNPEPKDKKKQ